MGVPSLTFTSDMLDAFQIYHSNADTLDHLKPDEMRQAATAVAGILLEAADSDADMPAMPLPTQERLPEGRGILSSGSGRAAFPQPLLPLAVVIGGIRLLEDAKRIRIQHDMSARRYGDCLRPVNHREITQAAIHLYLHRHGER